MDLVIWTKHFTKFASYTQIANSSSGNSNSTSNSTSSTNNSGATTPVCNDTKPASAPILLSAESTGQNEVTLTWSKASDPATYYLITYGLSPGEQKFGNPNVGDNATTSYTVKGLSSGQTYYFKVRAGNGCMPGDFSNELSATPNGTTLASNPIAQDFLPGVLGEKTTTATSSATLDQEILGNSNVSNTKTSTDEPQRDNRNIYLIGTIIMGILIISVIIFKSLFLRLF